MYVFYYDKPMKMAHCIYHLVPLRVPYSPLTKAGFDKSGGGGERGSWQGLQGGRAPCVGKFCISRGCSKRLIIDFFDKNVIFLLHKTLETECK